MVVDDEGSPTPTAQGNDSAMVTDSDTNKVNIPFPRPRSTSFSAVVRLSYVSFALLAFANSWILVVTGNGQGCFSR